MPGSRVGAGATATRSIAYERLRLLPGDLEAPQAFPVLAAGATLDDGLRHTLRAGDRLRLRLLAGERRLATFAGQFVEPLEVAVEEGLREGHPARTTITPDSSDSLAGAVETHIARYFAVFGDDLPPDGLYDRILAEIERPLLLLSLAATRGNQIQAAKLLGINRNTLRKKLLEHKLLK